MTQLASVCVACAMLLCSSLSISGYEGALHVVESVRKFGGSQMNWAISPSFWRGLDLFCAPSPMSFVVTCDPFPSSVNEGLSRCKRPRVRELP